MTMDLASLVVRHTLTLMRDGLLEEEEVWQCNTPHHKQSQFYMFLICSPFSCHQSSWAHHTYIQKAEVPKWRCDAQDEFEFEVRSDTVDAGGRKEKEKKDKTPVEAVRRWRWWNQHNSVDYQTAGDAEIEDGDDNEDDVVGRALSFWRCVVLIVRLGWVSSFCLFEDNVILRLGWPSCTSFVTKLTRFSSFSAWWAHTSYLSFFLHIYSFGSIFSPIWGMHGWACYQVCLVSSQICQFHKKYLVEMIIFGVFGVLYRDDNFWWN